MATWRSWMANTTCDVLRKAQAQAVLRKAQAQAVLRKAQAQAEDRLALAGRLRQRAA